MLVPNKRLVVILSIAATLVLLPLFAMQFTDEVHWKPLDFIVAGGLLFGTGLLLEFVLRNVKNPSNRGLFVILLLLVLLLIWAELAVGLFGTPFAGS